MGVKSALLVIIMITINMLMPVQQNSLTHLRALSVLHDRGIRMIIIITIIIINMLMPVNRIVVHI
jgi:hypothetical protein